MMNNYLKILTLLVAITLCSTGCDSVGAREKGALTGTAIGAGLGAIVGNQSGRAGEGTAIGAGAGALLGGILGNEQDKTDEAAQKQEERLRRQEEELQRQRDELDELRRDRSRDYDSRREYDSRRDDYREGYQNY